MRGADDTDAAARAMATCLAEALSPSKIVRIPSEYGGDNAVAVDLLVVTATTESIEKRRKQVKRLCARVAPKVTMDALVLTPEEVEKRLRMGDTILDEILRYGETLYEAPGGSA